VLEVQSVWPRKDPTVPCTYSVLVILLAPILIMVSYFWNSLSEECLLMLSPAILIFLILLAISAGGAKKKTVEIDEDKISLKQENTASGESTAAEPKSTEIQFSSIKEVESDLVRVESCVRTAVAHLLISARDGKTIELRSDEFSPESLNLIFHKLSAKSEEYGYRVNRRVDFHAAFYICEPHTADDAPHMPTPSEYTPTVVLDNRQRILERKVVDIFSGIFLLLLPLIFHSSPLFSAAYILVYFSYIGFLSRNSPYLPIKEVYFFDSTGFRAYAGNTEIYRVSWESVTSVSTIHLPFGAVVVDAGKERLLVRNRVGGLSKGALKDLLYNMAVHSKGHGVEVKDHLGWLSSVRPGKEHKEKREFKATLPQTVDGNEFGEAQDMQPYRKV